jgi:hypothetical protein
MRVQRLAFEVLCQGAMALRVVLQCYVAIRREGTWFSVSVISAKAQRLTWQDRDVAEDRLGGLVQDVCGALRWGRRRSGDLLLILLREAMRQTQHGSSGRTTRNFAPPGRSVSMAF